MRTDNLLFFQDLQLTLFQIIVAAILLFVIGYWLGTLKSKKLMKRMAKMEKKIMDLNSELLYGHTTAQ